MTIIYALCCPKTGDVRYVGKTDSNLAKRLARHIIGCESPKDKHTKKNMWIAQVASQNQIPKIVILEELKECDCWEKAEIRWIAHYRKILGDSLLNSSTGGKGVSGYKFTEEAKAKLVAALKIRPPKYGRVVSEETKAKTSASLKGRTSSRVGYKHSPKTLAKMASSRKALQLKKIMKDSSHV